MRRTEQFGDMVARLSPSTSEKDGARTVTFQVTDACSLKCTYCYQINKGTHAMSFETAKKFTDLILSDNKYLDRNNSNGVIIEFIGGEPFLEIDLINQITEYFIQRMIELRHPWATKFRISICSNGVAYFDPRVQAYIKKYFSVLSFSISIDGNKELHDSCRVFPDGSGSYDIAMAGVKHFTQVLHGTMGSKMTIAPQNIKYVFEAVKSLIENGYTEINLNCVYEKGWNIELAKELYHQLSLIGDYIIENHLEETHRLSIFEDRTFFKPKTPGDDENWCFRGDTLILNNKGKGVRIDSLKQGDLLRTLGGEVHKVKNITSHLETETLRLKVSHPVDKHTAYKGQWYFKDETFTTYTHPYLTKKFVKTDRYGRDIYTIPRWEMAMDLEKNDLVAMCSHVDNKAWEARFNKNWADIEWLYVLEVDKKIEPYQVYNLEVDKNHTFIANGIIVHNCGGTGKMISVDYKGDIYPCIRYMESSLGTDQEPIIIGNTEHGILKSEKEIAWNNCLQCITRKTESSEECYNCPIAAGCSWCSAYNYQMFGTPDKRTTFTCIMHIARALANARFFNKLFYLRGERKYFRNYVPEDWALQIISEDELCYLDYLENTLQS